MRLATMLILAAVAAPALAAQTPRAPSAFVDAAGVVSVSFDESLLRQPEVRKQIWSGLTTNLIVGIDRRKSTAASTSGSSRGTKSSTFGRSVMPVRPSGTHFNRRPRSRRGCVHRA